jgi:hypothetical protein
MRIAPQGVGERVGPRRSNAMSEAVIEAVRQR